MSFDWQKIAESKRAYRAKLAALPIAKKLRLLEQLSERAATIKRSRVVTSDECMSRRDEGN